MRRDPLTRRSARRSDSRPAASSRCCSAPGRSWPRCCAARDRTMRNHTCPHVHELLEALQTSRPADLPEPLREHVVGCARCNETLSVVGALLAEREALMREAAVPSSAIVWWRAQMRSRREAAAAASRASSYGHGLPVACRAGPVSALRRLYDPEIREGMVWIAGG